MKKINVAEDFSPIPGGRHRRSGSHSAEEFREEALEPLFLSTDDKIEVNLDGGMGYAASFLEEAFGGLARKHGKKVVQERLSFISTEQPYLVDNIREYIDDVEDEVPKRPCNEVNHPEYPHNQQFVWLGGSDRLPGVPPRPGGVEETPFCPKKDLPEDNGIVFLKVEEEEEK